MFVKQSYPEGTSWIPHTYSFLKPARIKIRRPDGLEVLMGYGIGEQIDVLQPSCTYLVCSYEPVDEVPLPDGGAIIEWPNDITMKFVK